MVQKNVTTFRRRSDARLVRHHPGFTAGSLVSLVFISLMIMPCNASGQDSLCIHFDSPSRDLHLELERGHSVNALLPATLCDLSPGDSWRIRVDGLGLEMKAGKLVLGTDAIPSIQGRRSSSIFRNLLIPGRGNIKEGRKVSGWTDLGVVLTTGYYYLTEEFEYGDMKEEYEKLIEERVSATTYEEIKSINNALHFSSRALNVQNSHRKRALILLSATYAGQLLLDPILFGGPPAWSVEAGGSIVNLASPSRSRKKAILYSLIWPGRGQFYQGKQARGFLMTGLATAAGIYVLDRMNAYDECAFQYEIDIEKWRNTSSPEEKEYYEGRATQLWSDLDEVKKERDTALIILGSIWGLGLLDTFFPLDEFVPSAGGLSVKAGPTGMTIALDF